jgi:hypothetical protein
MNTDSNISVLEQEEDRNINKFLDEIDEEKKKYKLLISNVYYIYVT